MAMYSLLELGNAIYENVQIQEEIEALYHIFTRWNWITESWKKKKQLPGYLKHAKDTTQVCGRSGTFLVNIRLEWAFSQQLKS